MKTVHGADPEALGAVGLAAVHHRERHDRLLRRRQCEAFPAAGGEADHAADRADPARMETVGERRLADADDHFVGEPEPRVDGPPVLALQADEAGRSGRPEGRLVGRIPRGQQQVVDDVRRQPRAGVEERPAAVLLETEDAGAEAARPHDRPAVPGPARLERDDRARRKAGTAVVARPDPLLEAATPPSVAIQSERAPPGGKSAAPGSRGRAARRDRRTAARGRGWGRRCRRGGGARTGCRSRAPAGRPPSASGRGHGCSSLAAPSPRCRCRRGSGRDRRRSPPRRCPGHPPPERRPTRPPPAPAG